MGFLSKFEGKMEDTVEGAAGMLDASSISPVQIAKKAEKQMRREKVIGAGKQLAPTLYTVLVSTEDDARLAKLYPTIAGETETYLKAKAAELGLSMDGQPLVRFIADPDLKRGKFDVVAEMVASAIVLQLRDEEMARYGLAPSNRAGAFQQPAYPQNVSPSGMPNPRMQYQQQHNGRFDPYSQDPKIGYEYEDYPDPVFAPQVQPIPSSQYAPVAAHPAGVDAVFGGTPNNIPPAQDVYLYDAKRDIAYVLTGKPQKIGRESTNDIIVPDINASRVHAEIRREPTGAWVIRDLDSLNGITINSRPVKVATLVDADIIRIGLTDLEFQDLSGM